MSEADPIVAACQAVTEALRPRIRAQLAKQVTWPTTDTHADVRQLLETRIRDKSDLERTLPFWEATGYDLTAALTVVCSVDEAEASHLVGAALQAQVSAGQDLAPDNVLRLAERAACWRAGVMWRTLRQQHPDAGHEGLEGES